MAKNGRVKTNYKQLWQDGVAKAKYIALSPWRLFKFLCFSVGLTVIVLFSGVGTGTYFFLEGIPHIEKYGFGKYQEIATQKVLRRLPKGKKDLTWVPFEKINRDLAYAIVMSEDAQFFDHDGINYDAILRAMAQNWKNKKIVSGASTITQQVVKNLFLQSNRSLLRKVEEAILSERIESTLPKNKILEIYLNMAEFGPNIFGIHAASQYYFGKPPKEIDAYEGAVLALMLPSPRRNHHRIYIKQNLSAKRVQKIKRILRSMLWAEFISPEEYKKHLRRKNPFPKRATASQ
ncbi:MAG: transglycosylase domain-containing protein [Bdellovibrionaceae bacterium]|nr:transglycosylase domain-containing protein [Bdellovibrionales bacterium]MCB9083983.1 transglycosylase domain-containing protein [Pseudobdellovibrionaceae bacterium]